MTLSRPGLVLAVLLLAPAARSNNLYVTFVPNYGVNSCNTCHSSGNALNPFGQAFQSAGANSTAWASLFELDSDVDGQTNGEELGDPCGAYTAGGSPARTTQISHPANPMSMSSAPSAPDEDSDDVSDGCDNCPVAANPDQEDTDGDGDGDVCDGAGEGEGEGEPGEGEGEPGEGEGEPGEGEGEGDAGGEGEGEGEAGPCTSSSVNAHGPGSVSLASLALLALALLRRRAARRP